MNRKSIISIRVRKMEEALLMQRKRQLEAEIEAINNKIKEKQKKNDDDSMPDLEAQQKASPYDNLRRALLLMSLLSRNDNHDETSEDEGPRIFMSVINRDEKKEKENEKKDVPEPTPVPQATVTPTMKEVIQKRVLDHYNKIVTELFEKNPLECHATFKIDALNAGIIPAFVEHWHKQQMKCNFLRAQDGNVQMTVGL